MRKKFAIRSTEYLLHEPHPLLAAGARVYTILPSSHSSHPLVSFETAWRIYWANFCECVSDLCARIDCLSGSCGSRSRDSKTLPLGQVLACRTPAPGAEISAPCACSMCCTWGTSTSWARRCGGISCEWTRPYGRRTEGAWDSIRQWSSGTALL